MADELKVGLGVELDLEDIQSQLDGVNKNSKIKVSVDTKEAEQKVNQLKNSMSSKAPAKIVIDVLKGQSDAHINGYIKSIQSKFQASPIKLTFGVDEKATQKNIDSVFQNMQLNIQKQVQQAAKQATQQAQKQTSSKPFVVPDRSSKYQEDYGKLQRTTTISSIGKDEDGNKLVTPHTAIDQFKRDVGEMVTVVQKLTEAEEGEGKVWEEVSHTVTENLEQRAREIEKINNYFAKQGNEFDKMYSSAFEQGDPLTGKFADEALSALGKYQDKYTEVMRGGKEVTEEQKREIEGLRQAAALAIKEQQSLQSKFVSEKKQDYSGLFGQSKEWENALKQISDAENKLNDIQKNTFSGTNALTGDFAKEATNQIEAVRDKFSEIRKAAEESFSGASSVSKDELNKMLKDLESDLNRLAKIEYPSDKMAAQNVDVKKMFAADSLTEMENRLKSLNLSTSEYADKLSNLRDRLQEIGKVDSDPSAWANWRNEFHLLEGEINKFENSIQGMGQKLANSLDTKQLSQIDQIQSRLSNLDQNLSGAGVQAIQQNLAQLKTAYEEVQNQLNAPNLSDDQYRALAERLKVLDDQLKQVANATKIFNDGIQNEQAIQAYNRDVENLSNRFERLKEKYQEFLRQNPGKASASVEASMERFANALRNVDPTNIKDLKGDFRNLNTEVNNTIAPAQTLSQILSNNFGAVGQYLGRFVSVTYLITKAVSTIKSMANEVKEVDSSLVELQKVTSLTGQELDNFVTKAYDVGKGLGRTGKDVIDATTTFSRAGYDLQQATELAQSALVMTNVGVDIPNMESAASDMISILKAYDIQAEESMAVIDKLYNVSNKEPLDFGNLTDMLVTAGGTLAQTGTTLDETMALLTASFATMRDTSVANG